MNAPNFFSVLRVLLIPVFIIALSDHKLQAALAVFAAAAATDAIDGFLARRLSQKTALGAYLDPIADKLLLVSAFAACALLGLVPRWLAILVVSRDVVISVGIVLFRINAVPVEIRPSLVSKCTTLFQMVTIGAALLIPLLGMGPGRLTVLCQLTGLLTIGSGGHYLIRGMRMLNGKAG